MTTLTLIFALPLLAAIALAFVPRNFAVIMRAVAVGVTFVTMLLAVLMFWQFNGATADANGYKFVSTIPGLGTEALGIACKLGVDGLNVGLVLMGAIVAFAAACCSFEIKPREKEFYILLLTMTGGILGAFMSLDLFFFYFFHELALVPTFIMIGVWGRGEQKNYATFQITLYLSIGALIALQRTLETAQPVAAKFQKPRLRIRVLKHPRRLRSNRQRGLLVEPSHPGRRQRREVQAMLVVRIQPVMVQVKNHQVPQRHPANLRPGMEGPMKHKRD